MDDINQRRIIGPWLYASLIIIYAIFRILTGVAPETQINALQPAIEWTNYFFTVTGIFLYAFPINLIIAYGFLRRRFWTRYCVIVAMLTFPIYILTQFMWWGAQSINILTILVQLLAVTITLFYFSRKAVRVWFGEGHKFKVKSWHGLLASFIILIAFFPLITAFSTKIFFSLKYNIPFFVSKPEIVTLEKQHKPELFEKYKKVELLDMSFVIPKEFGMRRLKRQEEKTNKWTLFLYDVSSDQKGFISLGNSYIFDDVWKELSVQIHFDNRFEFEKFFLTSNWNPMFLVLHSIMKPMGENYSIKEIHINGIRGFLKTWTSKKKNHLLSEFSLYNSDDTRFASGTMALDKRYFNEDDILTIISSFEFLTPQDPDFARYYYGKGLDFYRRGEFIKAQFELANACYLSPDNPEYIYMFAKALHDDNIDGPPAKKITIEELLRIVLNINPQHKEAQQLLKEIKGKLSVETKK